MAERNERDMIRNMTVTAPIRVGNETRLLDINLNENSEESRQFTDLLNEISAVMVLTRFTNNDNNLDRFRENIRIYNEVVEQTNELKYLLNCELINIIDENDPEGNFGQLSENDCRAINVYLSLGLDGLNSLYAFLRARNLLTSEEFELVPNNHSVNTHISLSYLLMCKYGKKMQNSYRLSLLMNFYPDQSELEAEVLHLDDIPERDEEEFRRILESLDFERYCRRINSQYNNTLNSIRLESVSRDEFRNLDGIKELTKELEKICNTPGISKRKHSLIFKYIDDSDSGCYAVLKYGAKQYAAFSGIGDATKLSNAVGEELNKLNCFNGIFIEPKDSIKYYFYFYGLTDYITYGMFKKASNIDKKRQKDDKTKEINKLNRMFSCAERKFFAYDNVPELFVLKDLSATICVNKYPCYMCVRAMDAMEKIHKDHFTVFTYDDKGLVEMSSSNQFKHDETTSKMEEYDAKAKEVVYISYKSFFDKLFNKEFNKE